MVEDADGASREQALFHDWNRIDGASRPLGTVELDDETLGDGLQSPSVRTPTLGEKIEIIHAVASLGIRYADIGFPDVGETMLEDVVGIASEIDRAGLDIEPNCACRTTPADILPIAEAQQRSGRGRHLARQPRVQRCSRRRARAGAGDLGRADVLDVLTRGLDGAGIAWRLVLSHAKVRNHTKHILKKLDARSRVEAVVLALRNPR